MDINIKNKIKERNFKHFQECVEFCLIIGLPLKDSCELAYELGLNVKGDYLNSYFLKEYIKTFDDVCYVLNIKELPNVNSFPIEDRKKQLSGWKLLKIIKVFNGDWIKDFSNFNEDYYVPTFNMNGAFSYYGYDFWSTLSSVGLGWGFKNYELMRYCTNTFLEEYKEYYLS